MKKIAVFNHKEGVSKTTTVYNLGWKLAGLGKKVILLDSDSQCKLSLTILGDEYETFYENNPKRNLKEALSSVFMAKPELIKPMECIKVKDNKNLFLMPGSLDITEYEVNLAVSFQITNTFTTMKNLPGAFNYLIEKTAEKYEADYVLIDMDSSLSAINQALFLSSDYFIIPLAINFFANMVLKTLSKIIPNWEHWAKITRNLATDEAYQLSQNPPKFIGYTLNNFSNINDGTLQTEQISNDIKNTVEQLFIPNLRKFDLLLSETQYENYCIAEIPNFANLQAKAQTYGIPVYALTDKQLETAGDVLANQKEMRERFNVIYTDFANKVIKLTNNE